MNDGRRPLTPPQAKALLVTILDQGRVEFRPHARKAMKERGITEAAAVAVMRGGVVEPAEMHSNEWRYRVRVLPVYVVVTFITETHTAVVTAWRKK